MLRALLVDSEVKSLSNLESLLLNDCEGIDVACKANSTKVARDWLKSNHVDVIFLDITMPTEDGFQFLTSIALKNVKIVLVTAYNEYTLLPIKASAIDYILKPVQINELREVVAKLKLAIENPTETAQNHVIIPYLLNSLHQKKSIKKIAVPQLGSIRFIDLDEIVSLQADNNYTIIHLRDIQKFVISKTLRDFEVLLDEYQFVRIHKMYIVNLNYIKEYSTIDGSVVKMTDGKQWSISRGELDSFLEKMKFVTVMFGKYK